MYATEGSSKKHHPLTPVAEPPPEPVDKLPEPAKTSPEVVSATDGPPSDLHTFWDETPNLDTEVETLLAYPHLLTEDQLLDLHAILSHYLPQVADYGADFDFTVEIGAQIAAVKAMRSKVMSANGTLKDAVSTREAKEVLSASTTLLTTLMKHHDKIVNFDRQRALEEAVKAAVQTLPENARDAFFAELERRLGGEQ